jgi:hypothetical protein
VGDLVAAELDQLRLGDRPAGLGCRAMVLSLGLLTIEANHTLLRRSKKARRPPSRPVAMNVGVGAYNVGLVVWRLAKYSEAVGEFSARHRNIRGTGEVSVYTHRSGDVCEDFLRGAEKEAAK